MPRAFQLTDEVSPLVSMLDPDKAYVQSPAVHAVLRTGLFREFTTDFSTTLSATTRANVMRRIREVCEELQDDADNGFAVNTVHPLTRGWAQIFLRRLPTWVADPDVGADPNGDLTFEWYSGRDHVLSISLAPNGEVVYAYANGRRRESGCDDVTHGLPDNILELLATFH